MLLHNRVHAISSDMKWSYHFIPWQSLLECLYGCSITILIMVGVFCCQSLDHNWLISWKLSSPQSEMDENLDLRDSCIMCIRYIWLRRCQSPLGIIRCPSWKFVYNSESFTHWANKLRKNLSLGVRCTLCIGLAYYWFLRSQGPFGVIQHMISKSV